MYLTAEEQAMLRGERGEAVQLCAEIAVKTGTQYGAERLLPVKNAHIDAAAYTTVWEAGTEFLAYLVDRGARVAVPSTINPVSRDIRQWERLGQSPAFSEKSRRIEELYLKLGVIPTWTCAPYQCTNLPQFGEAVCWSESNAVCFVNSVVGARAERLPDLMDVACAVIGRVPAYGRYLDRNRGGELLLRLEGFSENAFRDSGDYALLGYLAGEIAGSRVPVIEGLPQRTTKDELKALSAAAASGGAVSLFHAAGLTPEAPDTGTAFRGRTDCPAFRITPEDIEATRRKLTTAPGGKADMVLLGCPHLSADELFTVRRLLNGRRVAHGTRLLLMTSETQYALAARAGVALALEEAGAFLSRDTCFMEIDEGNGRWRGQTVVTNSGKAAQYAPGINGVRIVFADTAACIEAAVSGRAPQSPSPSFDSGTSL